MVKVTRKENTASIWTKAQFDDGTFVKVTISPRSGIVISGTCSEETFKTYANSFTKVHDVWEPTEEDYGVLSQKTLESWEKIKIPA